VTTLLVTTAAKPLVDVEVTGVRLSPAGDGPELTIELSGAAGFSDFSLDDPWRIVVDVEGASEALPRERYSIGRGGVAAVRFSQLTPGVVRVIVDLERPALYSVDAVGD